MNTEVRFTGCTTEQLREIAASLSKARDEIRTYNHSGSTAPHWAPVVHCEGPELFTITTPVVPASVAARILDVTR